MARFHAHPSRRVRARRPRRTTGPDPHGIRSGLRKRRPDAAWRVDDRQRTQRTDPHDPDSGDDERSRSCRHRDRSHVKRTAAVQAARRFKTVRRSHSAQSTVLAAATVAAAERGVLAVVRLLALHAQAHAGHGLAPGFGNRRLAVLAVAQARALRQTAARAADAVQRACSRSPHASRCAAAARQGSCVAQRQTGGLVKRRAGAGGPLRRNPKG
jgi:hypothetical protein